MRFKSKIKEPKGYINLFTLVSMIFFIIVLVGLYINSNNKVQKQQKEIQKIEKSYNKQDINKLYEETYNQYLNFQNEEIL